MAIARKCDACGLYYDNYNYTKNDRDHERYNGLKLISVEAYSSGCYHGEQFELCHDCLQKVMDILTANKEKDHEKN